MECTKTDGERGALNPQKNSISFCIDYSKRGTAKCKRCKQCIKKDVLRIGKPSVLHKKEIHMWYHVPCMFKTFENARDARHVVKKVDDLSGLIDLKDEDKLYIKNLMDKL